MLYIFENKVKVDVLRREKRDVEMELSTKTNGKMKKERVSSAEIIVTGTADKPYFEIKYFDLSDGKYHIGYSSYDLQNVFKWRDECFEIVKEND